MRNIDLPFFFFYLSGKFSFRHVFVILLFHFHYYDGSVAVRELKKLVDHYDEVRSNFTL